MKGKLTFVVGLGVGYVLGARAGKARYEQIKRQANRVWSSEPVQSRVGDATEQLKTQAAPYVVDKLGDTAKAVARSLKNSPERTADAS